jgi:hypothetical protein
MPQDINERLARLEADMTSMKQAFVRHSEVATSNTQELKDLRADMSTLLEISQNIESGMKLAVMGGKAARWVGGTVVSIIALVQAYYYVKTGTPPSITLK